MMIQDKYLGDIFFRFSNRAKRINVRIEKNKLTVTLPRHCTEAEGFEFVKSIQSKILAKRESIRGETHIITPEKGLETLTFKARVIPMKRDDFFSRMESGTLSIYYPENMDVTTAQCQHFFWNGIKYFLRKDAKKILPIRTFELAQQYNFTYSTVKIQSSTTRWGSCSSKGSINLSLFLLLLPEHLIDYVILHELCHTREMNHSDKFWKHMDSVTEGKSVKLKNELKNYSIPRW